MTGWKGALRRAAVVGFLGLVALPALVVSAGDVIDEFRLDRQDAADSVFDAFHTGRYAYGVPLAAFKALSPARQAEVVNVVGSFVRSTVESPEFKTRYAREWKAGQPRLPDPPRPGRETVAEKTRYDSEMAGYKRRLEDPKRLPEDPNQLVARRLREFLDLTAGIDYNARLAVQYGKKRFVDPVLEEKPEQWKLCFRAGCPAVDAARAFAESCLKQIRVGP